MAMASASPKLWCARLHQTASANGLQDDYKRGSLHARLVEVIKLQRTHCIHWRIAYNDPLVFPIAPRHAFILHTPQSWLPDFYARRRLLFAQPLRLFALHPRPALRMISALTLLVECHLLSVAQVTTMVVICIWHM